MGLIWESLGVSSADMPVVVSYFTNDFYLREAFDLARSCQQFGMDYSIHEVADKRSWQGNTNHKPTFLLEMHRCFPSRSLLWLDADARIRAHPELLRGLLPPIAYHTWKRVGRPGALSGTVYLNKEYRYASDDPSLEGTRTKILQAWRAQVVARPDLTDQVCMDLAVKSLGITHHELPETYTWIFDLGDTRQPNPANWRPVIEHMQASRHSRKLENAGVK